MSAKDYEQPMEMRDEFALRAALALIGDHDFMDLLSPEEAPAAVAVRAYEFADAMMVMRKGGQ